MQNRLPLRDLSALDDRLPETGEIGVMTDADGTLSEITESPGLARVAPAISSILGDLSTTYPLVAVISGRRAKEVAELVGQENVLYLGNHGLERFEGGRLTTDREGERAVAAALEEVRQGIPAVEGLVVEDKVSVIAVHYRRCRDDHAIEQARALGERIAAKRGLKMESGRRVFELKPLSADKGKAILDLAAEFGVSHAIYMGDDQADLGAFKALERARRETGLGVTRIAVWAQESPPGLKENADYWVEKVSEIQVFLEWLARRAHS